MLNKQWELENELAQTEPEFRRWKWVRFDLPRGNLTAFSFFITKSEKSMSVQRQFDDTTQPKLPLQISSHIESL